MQLQAIMVLVINDVQAPALAGLARHGKHFSHTLPSVCDTRHHNECCGGALASSTVRAMDLRKECFHSEDAAGVASSVLHYSAM